MKKIGLGLLTLASVLALWGGETKVDYAQLAEGAFRSTVRNAETHDRNLGSIRLFQTALHFCRARRHLDKLDLLFDVAAEMQDRDETSRGCGNFRWTWRDGFVMDYNAVDFCMEAGSLIARDHLDVLTPSQRAKFKTLIDWSIRGCLNHRVRDAYTNIALMNAVNLILLGEACNQKEAFAEGVRRLDAFMLNTRLFGICEYASPTYTGVDLNNLHRLHANVRDAGVKDKATRLLRLFWTDLAVSSFAGAGRLGGPHSRDYDYLYGLGGVASYLRQSGLVPSSVPRESVFVDYAVDDWRIDDEIRAWGKTVPRLVEDIWGEDPMQYRVYWAGRHVALGVAGANYWNMDIPLAVDFASSNLLVRGYFIADGRRDPYGRKKIPEGTGPHQKTLHLHPFWAGAQRTRDALGLVAYHAAGYPPETPTLESHFVFPSEVDEILVDGERVTLAEGQPFARELAPTATLVVRKGGGAFGVRVVWARGIAEGKAKVALVWDALKGVPACRLTVAHHDFWGAAADDERVPRPGAAFWVRVCDEAAEPTKFAAFGETFRQASCRVVDKARKSLHVEVAGEEGPLVLETDARFASVNRVVPQPRGAVLAVNGRELGKEILGEVPGFAAYQAEAAIAKKRLEENRMRLTFNRDLVWEAEKGYVVRGMQIDADALASGGAYVWEPNGVKVSGRVSWQMDVADAGTYTLWGRVWAPTPDDDSFIVEVTRGEHSKVGLRGVRILPRTDWPTGVTNGEWKWVKFGRDLKLPKGPVVLTVHVRENGTKLDRLALTTETELKLK